VSNNTTEQLPESSPQWAHLEAWVRVKVQGFIQDILEEEVTEFLGRGKSERREVVDGRPGYRNGYGKERKLTLSCGTVTLRRPRVRGVEEKFESRLLPLFARKSKAVGELIPELYLHGLARGTSTSPCEGCWERRLPFQPARWLG
jgi:putative transposase